MPTSPFKKSSSSSSTISCGSNGKIMRQNTSNGVNAPKDDCPIPQVLAKKGRQSSLERCGVPGEPSPFTVNHPHSVLITPCSSHLSSLNFSAQFHTQQCSRARQCQGNVQESCTQNKYSTLSVLSSTAPLENVLRLK